MEELFIFAAGFRLFTMSLLILRRTAAAQPFAPSLPVSRKSSPGSKITLGRSWGVAGARAAGLMDLAGKRVCGSAF